MNTMLTLYTRRRIINAIGLAVSMLAMAFGLAWPYDAPAQGGTSNAAKLSDSNAQPGLLTFADRNPRDGSNWTANVQPSNHSSDGEAYLRRDSSVGFYKKAGQTVDFKCGYAGDDIYSANGSGAAGGGPPVDQANFSGNQD